MRGAVAVSANLGDITVTQGEEALTLYQFNTREAKHYFCSKCGIYTGRQRTYYDGGISAHRARGLR
ncbi:hypothetical protein GCM10011247_10650 [Pseudomonas plecoglossicida]|nr:hypothetical protein GCM10011247_10650 [Pseudomonas plecoglossicida]